MQGLHRGTSPVAWLMHVLFAGNSVRRSSPRMTGMVPSASVAAPWMRSHPLPRPVLRPIRPRRRPAAPRRSWSNIIEIKAANPDCLLFYRMGDFYELFFEDAEVAARALGIVLTKRGKHLGRDIPMCGVPIHPRRRIPASPDRARPPRRGLRAAGRPGAGAQARRQERGAARRRAPGHARHADRGHAARRAAQQLPAGHRARARVVERRRRAASRSPGSTSPPASFASPNATARASPPSWRGSSRARSSSPTRSIPTRSWRRSCARCRR